MGDIFLGVMVAGGIGGALAGNSSGKIKNACNQWQQTLDEYNHFACEWKNILNSGNMDLAEVKVLNTSLVDLGNNYKEGLLQMKDTFRQQELATVIGIVILIFIILISFLFKYFNVYGMVWNFIVNKK